MSIFTNLVVYNDTFIKMQKLKVIIKANVLTSIYKPIANIKSTKL